MDQFMGSLNTSAEILVNYEWLKSSIFIYSLFLFNFPYFLASLNSVISRWLGTDRFVSVC